MSHRKVKNTSILNAFWILVKAKVLEKIVFFGAYQGRSLTRPRHVLSSDGKYCHSLNIVSSAYNKELQDYF